jgi:small subunit ribosomal protein S1
VTSRYFLGQVLGAKVVHVADFGVFAELEEGVEGLVHHSELQADLASYEPGKQLMVEILSIDPHEQKIGLSEAREGAEATNEAPQTTARLSDVRGAAALSGLKWKGGGGRKNRRDEEYEE